MKTKKMHGFLCQSHATTAVCISSDHRSVIVPRVPDRTLVDHARLINLKYSRLADSRRFGTVRNKTLPVTVAKGSEKPIAVTMGEKRLPIANTPSMGYNRLSLANAPAAKKEKSISRANSITSRPTTTDQLFQVVVMRVSLHCQGCAGKVKKHLSKMEGVTSFSIDLESKRVTVMGHVSPVGVLESISKVKKAELWTC